jgi:putative ABC transport system ATP-binding protein
VILADEPTGNLDSATAEEVVDALRGLSDDGVTVVVVTHAEDVASRARRRIRLRDGRVAEDTSASVVLP